MEPHLAPKIAALDPGIERLCPGSYLIRNIPPDMRVPVGGGDMTGRDGPPVFVVADTNSLRPLLSQFSDHYQKYDRRQEPLETWLAAVKADVDSRLFYVCYGFTEIAGDNLTANSHSRDQLYSDARRPPLLSAVLNLGAAKCAEIAILGQTRLQQAGFVSSYCGGAYLPTRTDESAQPHSFVVIESQGDTLIWDPANPTKTNQGKFPSIYRMSADFIDTIREPRRNRFFEGTNIINKTKLLYGVSDGTNVNPEDIVN